MNQHNGPIRQKPNKTAPPVKTWAQRCAPKPPTSRRRRHHTLTVLGPSLRPSSQPPEFCLKIHGQTESPTLQENIQYQLIISNVPISDSFNIIVQRIHYPDYPIKDYTFNMTPIAPFKIKEASYICYDLISHPRNSNVVHNGATFYIHNSTSISIMFPKSGRYRSTNDKARSVQEDSGRFWQLLLLDPVHGQILASMQFEVVSSCEYFFRNRQFQSPVVTEPVTDTSTFTQMTLDRRLDAMTFDQQTIQNQKTYSNNSSFQILSDTQTIMAENHLPGIYLLIQSQEGFQPRLKVHQPYILQLSDKPITGTFDIFVRRQYYSAFPIYHQQSNTSTPTCPFNLHRALYINYHLISHPQGTAIVHYGATFSVRKEKSIIISFPKPGTYQTLTDRANRIKPEYAKHWQLLLLEMQRGQILTAMNLQVTDE